MILLSLYHGVAQALCYAIIAPPLILGWFLVWLLDQASGAVLFVFGGFQYWRQFLGAVLLYMVCDRCGTSAASTTERHR